ncbi:MAG: dioxygenase [Alphaproteobacteria bacterium]|nr:dioxygenase [Alphaproteobacteria bacterium]
MPVYFLTHGGGPWPWMKDEVAGAYDQLEAALVAVRAALPMPPRAILVITAHWEASDFAVSSSAAPGMIYDYYGFPPHTYAIRYPAPGSPTLARRVADLLRAGGVKTVEDAERGFDHGTFSLMQPLFPEAKTPVVQLSLKAGLDPAEHLAAGRLLAPLREEGVLIIGSGSSYHNLRAWSPAGAQVSRRFDAWLDETLQASPADRTRRLLTWEQAPAARLAHPREEHLLPLMAALGAAEDEAATRVYHEDAFAGAIALSSYRFG